MNAKVSEVLVDAALRNVPQARRHMHLWGSHHCALGVLHLACHENNEMVTLECFRGSTGYFEETKHGREVMTTYDLTYAEVHAIVHANDVLEWDFLTLARKMEEL